VLEELRGGSLLKKGEGEKTKKNIGAQPRGESPLGGEIQKGKPTSRAISGRCRNSSLGKGQES